MALTDTVIRTSKPRSKTFKLFDSAGLYLEVNPGGGKWWRWKYRFGGTEKRLSFGVYPEVSLKSARGKRETARQQIAAGIDPGRCASTPPWCFEDSRARLLPPPFLGNLCACRQALRRRVPRNLS